jgi:hypothetical protein
LTIRAAIQQFFSCQKAAAAFPLQFWRQLFQLFSFKTSAIPPFLKNVGSFFGFFWVKNRLFQLFYSPEF